MSSAWPTRPLFQRRESIDFYDPPRAPFSQPKATQEAGDDARCPLYRDKLELFIFYGLILCVFILLRATDSYLAGGGRRLYEARDEEEEEEDMDSRDNAEGLPAGFWMPKRTDSKLLRAQ
jgi:hypothetical protein